jgi:peptidoglycan-associated lipoprotein
MRFHSTLATVVLAGLAALGAGCAHQGLAAPVAPDPSGGRAPEVTITSTAPLPAGTSGLGVSAELLKACQLRFDDASQAPTFDFDQSGLADQDRSLLQQVATCLTTGPLKGRGLHLVGRADPRGEVEYNMALGEHRASAVSTYLNRLGVDSAKIEETSRGKLDATGTDDASWQHDRRVDIDLR